MTQHSYQLTRHPIGSLREMWQISYPLMLSFISGSLMMLADRLFLAHYSLQALNACANAGMAVWIFLIVPMMTAAISEVFAGQHHGAGQKQCMGEPIWQMVWLALFTTPILWAIGYFAGPWIFWGTGNEANEIAYFSMMLFFGPFAIATPAISGFFVAKGTVKLITFVTIFANIINIALCPIFIYGWGPVPEMGVAGAGLATGLATAVGLGVFLAVFLQRHYRQEYGTGKWKFQWKIFKECIRIGTPSGLGHINELLAHFVFFRLVILSGGYGLTIVSLTQSIYITGHFIIEGVSKSVTAIASNLIGGRQSQLLNKVLWSAVKLLALVTLSISSLILWAPEAIFGAVMSSADRLMLSDPAFMTVLQNSLRWICCFYLLDGLCWSLVGMLTAAGDTKFILLVGTVCNWVLYVIPVYFVLVVYDGTVDMAFMAIAICTGVIALTYYLRYKSQRHVYVVA
jgi:MATE family multidrug resistance protein